MIKMHFFLTTLLLISLFNTHNSEELQRNEINEEKDGWTPESLNEFCKTNYTDNNYIVMANLPSEKIAEYEKIFSDIFEEEGINSYFFELDKFYYENQTVDNFMATLMNKFYKFDGRIYLTKSIFILVNKLKKEISFASGEKLKDSVRVTFNYLKENIETKYLQESKFEEAYDYTMETFQKIINGTWQPESFGYFLSKSEYYKYNDLYTEITYAVEPEYILNEVDIYLAQLAKANAPVLIAILPNKQEVNGSLSSFVEEAFKGYKELQSEFKSRILMVMTREDGGFVLRIGDDITKISKETKESIEKDCKDIYESSLLFTYGEILKYSLAKISQAIIFNNENSVSKEEVTNFYADVILENNNYFTYDLFNVLDFSYRLLTDMLLYSTYAEGYNIYLFIIPEMKSGNVSDYASELFNKLVTETTKLKNGIIVFTSKKELSLAMKPTTQASKYLTEKRINYIIDKTFNNVQYKTFKSKMLKFFSIFRVYGTLSDSITISELAIKFNYIYYENNKYALFDLFLIMNDYKKTEELENLYFAEFMNKKTYTYMILVNDINSPNDTLIDENDDEFLDSLIPKLETYTIDSNKETQLFILYIEKSKTIQLVTKGRLQNTFNNKKKDMIDQTLEKIKSGSYEDGFTSLFNSIKKVVDDNEEKDLSKVLIILIPVLAIIILIVLIIIIIRCACKKRKNRDLGSKMLTISVTDKDKAYAIEAEKLCDY